MISPEKKNNVLTSLIGLLQANEEAIIEANKSDVSNYKGNDESMLDRLKVDHKKVLGMIEAVKDGLILGDPVGKILYTFNHENGMRVENRSVPFGNILIIYESRPDVTIEAALTAFKAGNKILLKGGKEARNTNLLLTEIWRQALEENEVSEDYVVYLDFDRNQTQDLIRNNTHHVDLIIPRGGEGLINYVKQNTDIPVIVSGRGNNFLYVAEDADLKMAEAIIINGKSRISVCNALDKVLIDARIPDLSIKLNLLTSGLKARNIEVRVDEKVAGILNTENDVNDVNEWYEEYLSSKILVSKVDNMSEAIEKINTYSGGHSATIVTSDVLKAQIFMNEVDCAAVYHNASTRFTDGGQFGFGAEMAISTQKVHFRGPIAIDQLVTNKWFIFGSGQIR
jgi:glutamate-5-semialdehyde dehydrogenase